MFYRQNLKQTPNKIFKDLADLKFSQAKQTDLNFKPISDPQIAKRKVLIVDDEKTNLLITKSKIEKNLNIVCDFANDGAEAVEIIKTNQNKYDLVLMDVQMPEMDGVTATKKIKLLNAKIPVIALTSLEYEAIGQDDHQYFSYYLSKPVSGHILHRSITKFIPALNEDLDYLGNKEQYLPELKGKKIILADDQELNLKIVSKKLINLGLEIVQAKNGKELVNIYQEAVKNNQAFDLIITDIKMPLMSGDEAARQIRKIEIASKIKYKNRVPIIALSGDGGEEDVRQFFVSQMTDYFLKGSDPENLIKIIALYLSPNKIYFNKEQIKLVSEAAKTKEDKIINTDKLRYFNDSNRKEFLEIFLADSLNHLQKIEKYYQENNPILLEKTLHALKGITGNVGAEILFQQIVEIESVLKNTESKIEQGEIEKIKTSYLSLSSEIKKLLAD